MKEKFDPKKYGGDFDWRDITNETERTYHFPDGSKFTIKEPEAVAFKPPYKEWAGGSHRIVDKEMVCYFIPAGWVAISWFKEDKGAVPYEW